MIRSMTGFGRADFRVEGVVFDVEVRSVNHRYLDLRVRLPRVLSPFEAEARAVVGEHFGRGKVDVSVQLPAGAAATQSLEIDFELVDRYVEAVEILRERHGMHGHLDADQALSLPGVTRFAEHALPEAALRAGLRSALDTAAERADAMRGAEGQVLARDLEERLARVLELAGALEGRAGEVAEAGRERLRKRSEKLARETGLLDEARLHQELVIAADRMDVSEEIVRLRSHVAQFREILAGAGPGSPVGRRLDFLLQELGREANTLGSKSADAPAAHLVVELKTELERLREQVQNVE